MPFSRACFECLYDLIHRVDRLHTRYHRKRNAVEADLQVLVSYVWTQKKSTPITYLWLVGNGGMVVIVVTIVPHSSIPY